MTFTKLFFDADRDLDGLLSGSISPIFAGLQHATSQASGRVHPRFDVVERDDTVSILAELPGLSKSDVVISLERDRITISGQTKPGDEYPSRAATENTVPGRVTHRERAFGAFSRTLQVPAGLSVEDIKASMKDGDIILNLDGYTAMEAGEL